MSAENTESTENTEKIEKTKEKRVLTETQLQVLKMAREKAVEKRKQLGDLKRKEKQLKEDKLSERIEKIKTIEAATLIKKKRQEKVASSSSSSSCSSSAESERERESEEETPRKGKAIPIADQKAARALVNTQTKARVKKVSHEALTNEVVRRELKDRIMKQNYIVWLCSTFCNYSR